MHAQCISANDLRTLCPSCMSRCPGVVVLAQIAGISSQQRPGPVSVACLRALSPIGARERDQVLSLSRASATCFGQSRAIATKSFFCRVLARLVSDSRAAPRAVPFAVLFLPFPSNAFWLELAVGATWPPTSHRRLFSELPIVDGSLG